MKKIKTISIAGILLSAIMISSTIATPIVAVATTTNSTSTYNTKTIVYSLKGSNSIVKTETIYGRIGYQTALVAPTGYQLVDPDDNSVKITAGINQRKFIKVKKVVKGQPVNTLVKFIDTKTNTVVATQKLSGVEGQNVALNIPDLYKLDDQHDTNLTLIANNPVRNVYVSRKPLAKGEVTNELRYRITRTNKVISSRLISGKVGERFFAQAPAGYRLVFNGGNVFFISNTDKIHIFDVEKDPDYASAKINFVNKKSGKSIGNTLVAGKTGQTLEIDFPNGYSPVNLSDKKITLTKATINKSILVQGGNTNENAVSPYSANLGVKNPLGAKLIRTNGKVVSRSLAINSDWKTDQKMNLNGQTYYRVSTDEWVDAGDVYEYYYSPSTITTSNGNAKSLYTSAGSLASRSVKANSTWYTDRYANINGTRMYRVSTNEWINSSDLK